MQSSSSKKLSPLNPNRVKANICPSESSRGSTRGGRLVDDPLYRQLHLAANKIFLLFSTDSVPSFVTSLISRIERDRDEQNTLPDARDMELLEMGASESDVVNLFHSYLFPDLKKEGLKRSISLPMSKHTVPNTDAALCISTPAPDILYGYNRSSFPEHQADLISLGNSPVANSQDLLFPFFLIEFKADGPSGEGSLWEATNQCLGGSASCVNIAARFGLPPHETMTFSISMNGTEARLYITWKEGSEYRTVKIDSFLLQKRRDYLELQRNIKNIFDWGKEDRLSRIKANFDSSKSCRCHSTH